MKGTQGCACVAALFATTAASGQGPDRLERGSRVRLSLLGGERLVGNVVASDTDTITLGRADRDGGNIPVSRQRITRAETSQGRKGAWWRIWLGVTVGASGGLLVGSALERDKTATAADDAAFVGGWDAGALGAGALIGSAVGAVGGYLLTPERWTDVPARSASVSLLPVPGGMGLRLALRF